ncbi:MAG: hypothetical protein J3Q66DRAFT_350790 [Benniella sp.]|nr:MAG: hypothetical protein J3Q66DRAFT_350790 [Benniella sp.]
MLDIQELDDFVCLQLARQDLAQCARVCKKWHSTVTPYLWRDLSWIDSTNSGRTHAFSRIVVEDYLYRMLAHEGHTEPPAQAQPSTYLPALSKYGNWIRLLPDPHSLHDALHAFVTGQDKVPTAYELVLHLFKRCSPDVRVDSLRMSTEDLNLEPDDPKESILEFCLPRLRHLIMSFHSSPEMVSTLMDLLDRCSTAMEALDLDIKISMDTKEDVKKDRTEEEPKVWMALKELTLHRCVDRSNTKFFWSWLMKRCSSVEQLRVDRCIGTAQSLTKGMLAHMPNLSDITLGYDTHSAACMTQDGISALSSGSRSGWKMVRLGARAAFGKEIIDALGQHFSSLAILDMTGYVGASGNDVVQVLRSCTNLQALVINDVQYDWSTSLDANVFMDVDSDTGSIKPWACERSLKVLKLEVIGIPRPDLKRNRDDEEYPGQGREIQGRVYDRLARLTNLERLRLGRDSYDGNPQCLEMSLESGLDKLSGLKRLNELSVKRMATRIGVKEVQWIAEHWPRMRAFYGLYNKKAATWLRENRPEIKLTG